MTENDVVPQKVYCKNCRHYREEIFALEYQCSARCAYVEYNSFNHKVSLLGKLEDNRDGNCSHYSVLPIKQTFWQRIFNRK
jgi:hypothetical protein